MSQAEVQRVAMHRSTVVATDDADEPFGEECTRATSTCTAGGAGAS